MNNETEKIDILIKKEDPVHKKINPNFYFILNSKVFFDKKLTDKEKLFFALITALTRSEGYCYASNSYFSDALDIKQTTISKSLTNLRKNGYIEIHYLKDEKTKQILERRIYVNMNADPSSGKPLYPLVENHYTPSGKPLEGIMENHYYNNKSINNTNILPLGLDAHNGSTLDKGTSKTSKTPPLSKESSIANQNRRRIEKIKSYIEERLSQLSDKKIIPAIRKLTPIRVELMKDRIKEEPSIGYWRTLFDKIEEDADIYSKSSWFNFEFLFRKESKQKGSTRDRILDGYYDFLREADNSAAEDNIMYPEGSLEQKIYEDLSSMVSDNLSKSLEKQHLLADVIDRISLLRRPEEKSENGIARGYIDYRAAFCASWDKVYQQEIRRYAEKHNMPICVRLICLESECWKSFEKEIKQRFTLVTHSDELSILQDEFDKAEAEAEANRIKKLVTPFS